MIRTLIKKSIRESYLLFLGCGTVLYVFCWVRVWITSRLEMGRFQNILESLPESWQKLAPVPIADLFSYEGRIAVTYEEPVVYLMMAVWCIARSSDAVSGQLGRGTMEMLLEMNSPHSIECDHEVMCVLSKKTLAIPGFEDAYHYGAAILDMIPEYAKQKLAH